MSHVAGSIDSTESLDDRRAAGSPSMPILLVAEEPFGVEDDGKVELPDNVAPQKQHGVVPMNVDNAGADDRGVEAMEVIPDNVEDDLGGDPMEVDEDQALETLAARTAEFVANCLPDYPDLGEMDLRRWVVALQFEKKTG